MRYLKIPASLLLMILGGAFALFLLGRAEEAPPPEPLAEGGTQFALFSRRTFGTTERPKFTLSYRDVGELDFRVYRIDNPEDFFAKLRNLHQAGEEDTSTLAQRPSALERFSYWKFKTLNSIKDFIRSQVSKKARVAVNKTLYKDDSAPRRNPLNHSDFQKIPLLNDYGLTESWREKLPKIAQTNYSTIPLATNEPGVYLVEAAHGDLRAYTLVFVTDVVVMSKSWSDQLIVYAVNRKTGQPVEGAQLKIISGTEEGAERKTLLEGSSASGGWKVRLPADFAGENSLLLVKSGQNFTAVDMSRSLGVWGVSETESYFEKFYTYTDRPVYRPAQTVYFKSILRTDTDRGLSRVAASSAEVSVKDADGKDIYQTSLPISGNGTISGSFTLPAEASLGSYNLSINAAGQVGYHYFQVQEYKKPEYKVSILFPKKRVLAGEQVNAVIQARYYFGAPVNNAQVQYYVYREPYYAPFPSADEYAEFLTEESEGEYDYRYGSELVSEGQGSLDKEGRLHISFDTKPSATSPKADDYAREYKYRIEATVTDAARRDIRESDSIAAVNGRFALHTSTDRYVYAPNEEMRVTVDAIDHDGKPVLTPFKLQILRPIWQRREDGYDREFKVLGEVSGQTDVNGKTVLSVKAPSEGEVELVAVAQEQNRAIASSGSYVWVTSEASSYDLGERTYSEIKMVTDRKLYRPGEEARIILMLPDPEAHLLLALEGRTLIRAWQMDVKGRTATVKVKLDSSVLPNGTPNVWLSAAYVRNGRMVTGLKSLDVPPIEKLLKVEVEADKLQYQPGERAVYRVTTRDRLGNPVAAEVSLGVVDEAVYAIQQEYLQSIGSFFYSRVGNYVQTSFGGDYDFSGYSGKEAWKLAARAAERRPFAALKAAPKVQVRKNFKDTAFWAPAVMTDSTGRAEVSFDFPDNLTTWRATARAVTADTRVGSVVEKVLVRKNLLLRLATPRFFTEGDEVTVSAIVHNYLKNAQQTQVSLETRGVSISGGSPSTSVRIDPGAEVRVDWKVKASEVGSAVLTAKAVGGQESDGMELTLPVLPHGIRVGHAEAVVLSEPEAQGTLKTTIGQNASPGSKRLRVDLSASVSGAAFAALEYLTSYPYGCTEQTMSSFLPNIIATRAMREAGASINADNLNEKVSKGFSRLYDFQHSDGGWGWWKSDQTDLYMTAYVVSGLAQASRAGYSVDQMALKRGRDYIKRELDRDRDWSDPIGLDDRVYLLYALCMSGNESPERVNVLLNAQNKLQPLSRALLALTLLEVGERAKAVEIAARIEATATGNSQESYWQTTTRPFSGYEEDFSLEATALSVKALSKLLPQSPVLQKAARWLVNHRTNGYYWTSTRQTAYAIDGLIDYAKVSGDLRGDYDWEVYLNDRQVSAGHFSAADAATGKSLTLEMERAEIKTGVNNVRIVKRGEGSLVASLASVYFTRESEVKPAGSEALSIGREYFLLDMTTDSNGQAILKPREFTGTVKGGELLLVRLTLKGKAARYVMVEDPFPAGTEPFTDDEPLPGQLPADQSYFNWARKEFRDDRVAFFVTTFNGQAVWQYVLRVQVPGSFRVAPARAERMYQPDVRANSASRNFSITE